MSDAGSGSATMLPKTRHGHGVPTVTQFSVFLSNRLGALHDVLAGLDPQQVRVVGLSVADHADTGVLRLIVDDAAAAREALVSRGRAFVEADVLVVDVNQSERTLADLCGTLLRAELNIAYVYALLVRLGDGAAVALRVDDIVLAARVLEGRFRVFSEMDLKAAR